MTTTATQTIELNELSTLGANIGDTVILHASHNLRNGKTVYRLAQEAAKPVTAHWSGQEASSLDSATGTVKAIRPVTMENEDGDRFISNYIITVELQG